MKLDNYVLHSLIFVSMKRLRITNIKVNIFTDNTPTGIFVIHIKNILGTNTMKQIYLINTSSKSIKYSYILSVFISHIGK